VALAVKLLLFLYCVRFKDAPSAMVLAQDHRNDLFVNSLGLTTAILGSRLLWWIDPVGAIVVALIILRSWLITAYEQIQLIIGKSADTDTINHITYIAMTHDPLIEQLDTVRAYHAGTHLYVEVDVVMSPETRLIESHDAAEALQNKLEQMPAIDRAFVHVDHEFLHTPEHRNAFT
jgi:divalent metal cation (Fe/Co/Zn/Cd) transporter